MMLWYDGYVCVDGDVVGCVGRGDVIVCECGLVVFVCLVSGSEVLCVLRDGEGWEVVYALTATLRDGDARVDFDDVVSVVYVGRDLRWGK